MSSRWLPFLFIVFAYATGCTGRLSGGTRVQVERELARAEAAGYPAYFELTAGDPDALAERAHALTTEQGGATTILLLSASAMYIEPSPQTRGDLTGRVQQALWVGGILPRLREHDIDAAARMLVRGYLLTLEARLGRLGPPSPPIISTPRFAATAVWGAPLAAVFFAICLCARPLGARWQRERRVEDGAPPNG